MIKEKLLRIYDLYKVYKTNEEVIASSKGIKASIRRHQVFLKEKIISSFNSIKDEMTPNLFVVNLTALSGEEKTVIMSADTYDDIHTFINLLQSVEKKVYAITHIEPLPTIFEGKIEIIIRARNTQ